MGHVTLTREDGQTTTLGAPCARACVGCPRAGQPAEPLDVDPAEPEMTAADLDVFRTWDDARTEGRRA